MSTASSIDLQGIRLLFVKTLPTLQEIASMNIAISVWYDLFFGGEFIKETDDLGDSLNEIYREELEKWLRRSCMPHLIQKLINNCLVRVEEEINRWIRYTKYEMLAYRKPTIYHSYLGCCVWQSNGRIDYRKTAQKMLSLPDFSKGEKFEIMCKYCLDNEIKNLSLDGELESYFRKTSLFRPLTFYWICYLKNELYKMVANTCLESLASLMITKEDVNNWPSFEYFWDRLSSQDQILKISEILTKYPAVEFQKRLFSKMSWFQLGEILVTLPDFLIVNFGTCVGEPEIALQIWIRIRNSMTGEQFLSTVMKILSETMYWETSIPLMVKLLNSANNHQIAYLLDRKRDKIIRQCFMPIFRCLPDCLNILIITLSYSSASYRMDFILTCGGLLMRNNDLSALDKIIKLCIPKDDERTQFKNQILTESTIVRNRCSDLFAIGEFEHLNKFVEFCSIDESTTIEYKRRILESTDLKFAFFFKPNEWCEFEKFVDHVYPEVSLAANVKKRLILSCDMNSFFNCTNVEILRHFIGVTSRFLTNKEMAEVKETLFVRFRNLLKAGCFRYSFDSKFYTEFTYWCLGDEKKVTQFKMTLSIDEIF